MPILEFDLPKIEHSIIKVIGVGGGGSNAVNHMYRQGIVGVDFAVCNTDQQALVMSPIPTKIQLGPGLTEGRGAGSKPEVGKHACIESIEDIQMFLNNGTKMLFITAGMGGGTGTGAAPIIAKAAKEMGILTVGIVTLPFTFEGRTRTNHAIDGLEEMKKNVDSIIVISNDKLREIYGNLTMSEAFGHADDILTTAAKGIAEIITLPGYINVDFEDVNTVMRESGVAIMGSAQAEGDDRALRAADLALNSPLLEENNISGARNILLNITSGSKQVTMDEVYTISEFVQSEAGLNTTIIWGQGSDPSLGDKISVTIIASGFESQNKFKENAKTQIQTIGLDDDFNSDSNQYSSSNASFATPSRLMTHAQQSEPFIMEEGSGSHQDQGRKVVAEPVYSKHELNKSVATIRLSNPETLMKMENEPAYIRRKVHLDEVPHSSESNYSTWSINENDELNIRNDNTFLRDLAD